MNEERCEVTDLLPSMCAHCRGDKGHALPPPIERRATANFDGRCALNPRHHISPGEAIGYTGEGWICETCTEDARA